MFLLGPKYSCCSIRSRGKVRRITKQTTEGIEHQVKRVQLIPWKCKKTDENLYVDIKVSLHPLVEDPEAFRARNEWWVVAWRSTGKKMRALRSNHRNYWTRIHNWRFYPFLQRITCFPGINLSLLLLSDKFAPLMYSCTPYLAALCLTCDFTAVQHQRLLSIR